MLLPSPSSSNPTPSSFYASLDASHPSILLLGSFSLFDKEKLDKEKANWTSWSWDIYVVMSLNQSYDYITGDAVMLDTLLKPCAHKHWLSNDQSACAFISSTISDAERKALGDPPSLMPSSTGRNSRLATAVMGQLLRYISWKRLWTLLLPAPLNLSWKPSMGQLTLWIRLTLWALQMVWPKRCSSPFWCSISLGRSMSPSNSNFRTTCSKQQIGTHSPLCRSRLFLKINSSSWMLINNRLPLLHQTPHLLPCQLREPMFLCAQTVASQDTPILH